ncbi:MAG: glycosyltransferase family 4 protein, partial [Candidatus Aminicenantes bacterium]|nr:glycosyltransferase family 4 protein [Candidatus Aminicenantes bacterium]
MKSILVITALDLWSMGKNKGAPSLWLTIQGYARHDWIVYFLTSGKSDVSGENLHSNIKIISCGKIWFQRALKRKRLSFFIRPLWWLSFRMKMYRQASQIAKSEEIDLFYGYEIYGTPIAGRLSRKFNKPCISRFQGTILAEKMKNPLWRLRHWHHYIGLKVPADLFIMTDDGTQGDKVLSRLGVEKSKVRFWMNGVNKEIFDPNFNPAEFKKSLHIPEQTKILLSVSRLVQWKRVDRIIKAMPLIVKSEPDTLLLIVGDGPGRNNLEKLSRNLSLQNRLVFFGALPHPETI